MKFKIQYLLYAALTVGIISCKEKKEEKVTIEPINVNVIPVGAASIGEQQISYSGVVEERKGVNLTFQVSGTVSQILVDQGQHVTKGQLIATVDETTYRNQYNAQLAQQRQAQDNFDRISDVFKKGSIAEVKMVEAKTNLEQAKYTAQATYQNILHCKLYASTEGYVGEKSIEVGAVASPGTPVVKIVNISTVNIKVPIPEGEIGKFKKGIATQIKIEALGNEIFQGKINEVGVVSDGNSHNYMVKIALDNPGDKLRPGMVANVNMATPGTGIATPDAQLNVPETAVQVDEMGTSFVYITSLDGKTAIRKDVKTGELLKDAIVIQTGIAPGDRVIITGTHKLTDQSPIHIIQ